MISALKGGGGGGEVGNKKVIKKTHGAKVIQRTGAFSAVWGTPPRGLLLWVFVVEHFRTWEQSWERLWNRTVCWCVLQQYFESVGVVAMMSEGVVQGHVREWVPASILAPEPRSIRTPRTWFCDQFDVSLETNAVLSRQIALIYRFGVNCKPDQARQYISK